jgi:guanylate kinase
MRFPPFLRFDLRAARICAILIAADKSEVLMKKYRLQIGLDVDDILYDCNAYALERLNREEGIDPPLRIYDIRSWGEGNSRVDGRIRYFTDPEFVATQPILPGAQEFVRRLCDMAEVFFVSAVPPACMSARALRLRADFPEVPAENILLGTRKDLVRLDMLLDDGAHNISSSPATYPVLFRKPWNVHLSGLLSVNTYDDFLHLVEILREASAAPRPDLSDGGVICLVGPTGSRKNELAARLVREFAMQKPVTATTRPRRTGETEADYHFMTEQEFLREIEAGAFLETTVYSGHHFGTTAVELDRIVERGGIAVIPIDICGALTLKNRYRSRANLVFVRRRRENVILDIVSRELSPKDQTCRILSLDDEYRNEELCDLTVHTDKGVEEAACLVARASQR